MPNALGASKSPNGTLKRDDILYPSTTPSRIAPGRFGWADKQ